MDLSELIGQTDELQTVRQQLTQPGRHLLTAARREPGFFRSLPLR